MSETVFYHVCTLVFREAGRDKGASRSRFSLVAASCLSQRAESFPFPVWSSGRALRRERPKTWAETKCTARRSRPSNEQTHSRKKKKKTPSTKTIIMAATEQAPKPGSTPAGWRNRPGTLEGDSQVQGGGGPS